MKRMYPFMALMLLTTMLLPGVTNAQLPHNPQRKMAFVDSRDTTSQLYKEIEAIVKHVEERRFTDPKAPRFMLIDQKRKFGFGIGGMVRVMTAYGFDKVIPGSTGYAFEPAQIPVGGSGYGDGQFFISPNTSEIFFKLVGNTRALGEFNVYTSINFTGPGGAPALRQGYVSFRGFTVGRAWNAFSDLSAVPPTIDFASPNSMSGYISNVLRFAHTFKNRHNIEHWQLGASIEIPDMNATYGTHTKAITQSTPDVIAFAKFKWNDGQSHIRTAGVMRNMNYRNTILEKNIDQIGWGVQMSGLWAMGKKAVLYAQYAYGEGIGAYINDISNFTLDLVPNPQHAGYLHTLPMTGWYVGLQWNFSPTVFASATYSQARVYYQNSCLPNTSYRMGEYIVGNLFWNVTEDFQLGVEYLYGSRQNRDRERGTANRANMLVQYNF